MGKLTGKTALITGASQGIGEGIAKVFARHGANLILLDISDEIEKLADELGGRGHRCTAVIADVTNPASVAAALKKAKAVEGRIDILVNNAGVCRLGSFLDMTDEDRDFHIDVNIKGVWNVTKAVLPEMIKRKDGRIVMMSSVTGDMVADPGNRLCVIESGDCGTNQIAGGRVCPVGDSRECDLPGLRAYPDGREHCAAVKSGRSGVGADRDGEGYSATSTGQPAGSG